MKELPNSKELRGFCRWCNTTTSFGFVAERIVSRRDLPKIEQIQKRPVNRLHADELEFEPPKGFLKIVTLECNHCLNACVSFEDVFAFDQKFFWPILAENYSEDIPSVIRASLYEAEMTFQVGCFMSSATMTRRALEAVCDDKGITGGKLQVKIQNLSLSGLLPRSVTDWLDDIRVIGNDGAHPKDSVVTHEDCYVSLKILHKIIEHLYIESAEIERIRRKNRSAT
jgi:hypothetical protein